MAGKVKLVFVCLFAALALALLFGSDSPSEATTYKVTYQMTLGCNGADGVATTLDDSCVPGAFGARTVNLTADLSTAFVVPVFAGPSASGRHSSYGRVTTFHAPPGWKVGRDDKVADAAFMARLSAATTLSTLNSTCSLPITVVIPLYECSTDRSLPNQIPWVGNGTNLTKDANGDGTPDGCEFYPSFLDQMLNGQTPRARYYGWSVATPGAPPSQLQFAIMNPGQLTSLGVLPDTDLIDSLGYSNFVVLDNPTAGAAPSQITELCAPLATSTLVFGKTQGEGEVIQIAGLSGEVACDGLNSDPGDDNVPDDGCWAVTDSCATAANDDGDATTNELCGIAAEQNPATATSGILGTGTHLVGAYSESNRDADGDNWDNSTDACPTVPGVLDNANGCDGCPAATCANADVDTDGFQNRQDSCISVSDNESVGYGAGACAVGTSADEDQDNVANDGCPTVGTPETDLQCLNLIDDDADGNNINDGCPALLSRDADRDSIGVLCDANDSVANGEFVSMIARSAVCVGAADADIDGWCDTTECVGGYPACPTSGLGSDPANAASTPENSKVDARIRDITGKYAPATCSDLDYYVTKGDVTVGGTRVDDDLDGATEINFGVNDGCPIVNITGEDYKSGECENLRDDDGDTVVNDGCAAIGAAEAGAAGIQCTGNFNDDDTTNDTTPPGTGSRVNDGCPIVNVTGENPATQCNDALDDDADGYVNDGCPVMGTSGETGLQCSGNTVDDDADGDANCDTGWNPGGCAGDADCDGVLDATDNCTNVANPDQQNTDGSAAEPLTVRGDACDLDDDADDLVGGIDNTDAGEWLNGTDPKDPCSGSSARFDTNDSGKIDVSDVLNMKPVFNAFCRRPQ